MSISLRSHIRQALLLGCASGAALLVLAAGQASAATYPGGGSTFTGSAEGWKAESQCKVLNLAELPLACTASGAYDETAGAPPGSFAAKTQIPVNAVGAFKSVVTADSPAFTAAGSGAGSLSLSRAFAPGGLLRLTPQFDYSAYLVDKTAGTRQKAISETIEGEVPFADQTAGVSLTAGDTYLIEIVAATSSTVASVGLLGGEAIGRFDDVVVTGPGGSEGNPGGPGNGGNYGATGGGGASGSSGGVSGARLERMLRSSMTGPATIHGTKVSVKASCPKKVGATCTLSLQGMLNRHKPATTKRQAKVKTGKTKKFALTVKPAARPKVKTKSKLLFKETVKVGKAKATVWKTLKLVRK